MIFWLQYYIVRIAPAAHNSDNPAKRMGQCLKDNVVSPSAIPLHVGQIGGQVIVRNELGDVILG